MGPLWNLTYIDAWQLLETKMSWVTTVTSRTWDTTDRQKQGARGYELHFAKMAKSSNWESPKKMSEKTSPQISCGRSPESLGVLSGDGLPLYESSFQFKNWDWWLFFQMYRYQHKVKRNMKKQKITLSRKQNKSL